MSAWRLLECIGEVDERYVEETMVPPKQKRKFKLWPYALAAVLALALIGGGRELFRWRSNLAASSAAATTASSGAAGEPAAEAAMDDAAPAEAAPEMMPEEADQAAEDMEAPMAEEPAEAEEALEAPATMPEPADRDQAQVADYFATLPEDPEALFARGDLVVTTGWGQVTGISLWDRFLEQTAAGESAHVVIADARTPGRIYYVNYDGLDYYLCVQQARGGAVEEYTYGALEAQRQEDVTAAGEVFRVSTSYRLTSPVGGDAPVYFGILSVSEDLGDPGVVPIGEATEDREKIEGHLASFPEKWFGCLPELDHVVENVQGQMSEQDAEKLQAFLRHMEAGEIDYLTCISYTVEGDPIITYAAFVGDHYLLAVDAGRDSYGGGGIQYYGFERAEDFLAQARALGYGEEGT